MGLVRDLLKNHSGSSGNVTVKILPQYSAKTYTSPVEVEWFSYENYANDGELEGWERQWTDQGHSEQIELMRRVLELLGRNEIEFSIDYGTIIGSYRHFDFVPWDDDAVSNRVTK